MRWSVERVERGFWFDGVAMRYQELAAAVVTDSQDLQFQAQFESSSALTAKGHKGRSTINNQQSTVNSQQSTATTSKTICQAIIAIALQLH